MVLRNLGLRSLGWDPLKFEIDPVAGATTAPRILGEEL